MFLGTRGHNQHKKTGEPSTEGFPGSQFRFLSCTARLPAAVSAATAAAITAVAVPASAPAATAPTTAASSSAPATAEAAATAPASPTAPAFSRGTGFVDDNITAHEIVAVQSLDGALGFLVAIDLDKSEPAWLP